MVYICFVYALSTRCSAHKYAARRVWEILPLFCTKQGKVTIIYQADMYLPKRARPREVHFRRRSARIDYASKCKDLAGKLKQ